MVDSDMQNSEHSALRSLSESSDTIRDVLTSHQLYEALNRNLDKFMERRQIASVNQLGVKSNVAPNTIWGWKNLSSKDPTKTKAYPRLDLLERVAEKLNCEIWELFHPNIEQLRRDLAQLQAYRDASKKDVAD